MSRTYRNPSTNAIGSVYSGAALQGNTKTAVEANGQVLSKATYPELADEYGTQSARDYGAPGFNNQTTTNTMLGRSNSVNYRSGASTSTYSVYAESITEASPNGYLLFWSSANGEHWRQVECIPQAGLIYNVVPIGSSIYICTSIGIWRTNDGLSFTKVFDGLAYGVASNGSIFVIASNSASSYLTTTDWITFTTRTNPNAGAFNFYNVVYLAPNFYVFQSSSTTQYYSSDGISWTVSPNALPGTAIENGQYVANNTLFVARNSGGAALFYYNANPVTTAWASSATNSSTHGYVTGVEFDSLRSEYVVTVTRTSGVFGYVFTSLASAATSTATTGSIDSGGNTFVTRYGTTRIWHLPGQFSLKTSSGTWVPAGTNWGISSDDAIHNPFFINSRGNFGGTTTLGNRYFAKSTGVSGSTNYSSVNIEINGVFYPLTGTSFSSASIGTLTLAMTCVYEDATGYVVGMRDSNPNIYVFAYSANRTRNYSTTMSNGLTLAVPNTGLMYVQSGSTTTSRSTTVWKPNGPSSGFSSNITLDSGTATDLTGTFVMHTGEVVFMEMNTGAPTSVTFYQVWKDGAIIHKITTPSLYNASNAAVSITADLKVWKMGGLFYAAMQSRLYRSSNGVIFNDIGVFTQFASSNSQVWTQLSDTFIVGPTVIINNFGSITWANHVNGSQNWTANQNNPQYIKLGSSLGYISSATSSNWYGTRWSLPFNDSTQFKVPAIPSSTSGQSNYIVAR